MALQMKPAFQNFISSGYLKWPMVTPHQYLTAVRINKAQLLLQNDTPVTDTCFAVGFESLTSFIGLFKRITGISPSIYRQQQRQRKHSISITPLNFIPNCFAEQNGWK
jgi:hypothetical protein